MGARHVLICAPEQYTRVNRDSTRLSVFAIAIAIGIGIESRTQPFDSDGDPDSDSDVAFESERKRMKNRYSSCHANRRYLVPDNLAVRKRIGG